MKKTDQTHCDCGAKLDVGKPGTNGWGTVFCEGDCGRAHRMTPGGQVYRDGWIPGHGPANEE